MRSTKWLSNTIAAGFFFLLILNDVLLWSTAFALFFGFSFIYEFTGSVTHVDLLRSPTPTPADSSGNNHPHPTEIQAPEWKAEFKVPLGMPSWGPCLLGFLILALNMLALVAVVGISWSYNVWEQLTVVKIEIPPLLREPSHLPQTVQL